VDAWRTGRRVAAEAAAPPKPLWKIPAFAVTLALCVIMVGNGVRPVSAQAREGKAARQVWVTRSTDDPLAVSPDGRYFAFTDWQTGDLAIRDMSTETNRRLTNTPGFQEAEAAVFSPDGSQIAFNWFTYKTGSSEELAIVPASGGAPRTIWSSKDSEEYVIPEAWSPDGKELLLMYVAPNRASRIVLMSVRDGSQRQLKSVGWQAFNARFSPDGKFIAYDFLPSASSSKADILALAVDGSSETTIVQNPANDTQPIWSPDGARILFLSDRTGHTDLWSVAVENGKPGREELVKSDVGPRTTFWMTRGGTLFYRVQGPGGPNIYSIALGPDMKVSSAPVLTVDSFVYSNGPPSISPNGEFLAYRSSRAGSSGVLVIRALKTGAEHIVSTSVPPIGIPRWFPDSRSVLVLSRVPQGPGLTLYRVDTATGKTERVSQISGNQPVFNLSPDGNSVYYTDGARLIRLDLANRRETELNQAEESSFYSISISPDGKQLAYLFWGRQTSSSIRIMPVAGGESREVFSSSPWADGSRYNAVSWTPDQKSLFVTAPKGGGGDNALWRVPVSGGPAESMGLSMPKLSAVGIHPDGKNLFFFSNDAGPTEVWALDNFLAK
jgi:Tol biopolymer transport system component